MVIYGTEQVSPEVIKINSSAGLAFFIRTTYLKIVDSSKIVTNAEFLDQEEEDILEAGMSFAVESKAMDYLARAEQCRFGLTQKLLKKGYKKNNIDIALDYLEQKNYLNDKRFADSWLTTRQITSPEGRIKLLAELCSRGISRDVSEQAIKDFFEITEETDLARKCYAKCIRMRKSKEKTVLYLQNHGFSYSLIKKIMNEEE